jgi:hypothetical protein
VKKGLGGFFFNTVKLGFKERLDKEQRDNSEPFPMTNMPVYLIINEQIGCSEQLCDKQPKSFLIPSLTVVYNDRLVSLFGTLE